MELPETIDWPDMATNCDILAGEFYDHFVDCRFAGEVDHADLAWACYLEQIEKAQYARKRLLELDANRKKS